MLSFMRHLEIHVIETDRDIDLAVQAGLLELGQLTASVCVDCDEPVGHSASNGFRPFTIVLEEEDEDWAVCIDCASPVVDGHASSTDSVSYEALIDEELDDIPELLFDDEEFEKF